MKLHRLLVGLLGLPTVIMAQPACDLATADWARTGDPVLRDPIPGVAYEVAGDPHVFAGPGGTLHMIYSGDDEDHIAIKLASATDLGAWEPQQTLLGMSTGHDVPRNKETAFYHLTDGGEHQIYFIGYEDEETYEASVYLATSANLDGPYTILPDPVMPRGLMADRQVYLITSPSVVAHDGVLHMAFLGWNGFADVTAVWVFGAVSSDAGRTWQDIAEIDVPIGMEGQITPHPDGGYVAARTGNYGGREGISIACADHPFGPYTDSDTPVLQIAGPPWEVEEIIAPQIMFDPATGTPNLFYTGADYATGWWVMRALPAQ